MQHHPHHGHGRPNAPTSGRPMQSRSSMGSGGTTTSSLSSSSVNSDGGAGMKGGPAGRMSTNKNGNAHPHVLSSSGGSVTKTRQPYVKKATGIKWTTEEVSRASFQRLKSVFDTYIYSFLFLNTIIFLFLLSFLPFFAIEKQTWKMNDRLIHTNHEFWNHINSIALIPDHIKCMYSRRIMHFVLL